MENTQRDTSPLPPLECREDLEYKYVLLSDRDGSVASWQPGGNQVLHLDSDAQVNAILGYLSLAFLPGL